MITAQNLRKNFGSKEILCGLNFTIPEGAVTAFLGPNGAGKTTTLRILAGILYPSGGKVTIGGVDVEKAPRKAQALLGYLPENPPLYKEMTLKAYLEFFGKLKGLAAPARRTRMEAVVERFQLATFLRKPVGTLSQGMRQRAGLAQACLADPPVLLLDEPTTGLDPHQVADFRKFLKEIQGTKTVLLSTHLLAEAEKVSTQILILHQGRLMEQPGAESRETRTVRVRVRRPTPKLMGALRSVPGVRNVGMDPSEEGLLLVSAQQGDEILEAIAQCCMESGAGLVELHGGKGSLEAVFRQVTGKGLGA